jgi:hypothetical protein
MSDPNAVNEVTWAVLLVFMLSSACVAGGTPAVTSDAGRGSDASAAEARSPDPPPVNEAGSEADASGPSVGPLSEANSDQMLARPASVPASVAEYLGMGGIKVERDPVTDAITRFTKYGDFVGTYAVVRYLPPRRIGLVILMNADLAKTLPNNTAMDDFETAALAVDQRDAWPTSDLFGKYPR